MNKKISSFLPWILILGLLWHPLRLQDWLQPSTSSHHSSQEKVAWSICFTPGGNCTEEVVRQIEEAKQGIRVQAYSFTSAPIAKALVEAKKRGLKVEVILDKSQDTEKYSSADFLVRSEIPTWIDRRHAIAHNKVMVMDEKVVLTGSFNFTKAAQEKNAENLLTIFDPELARFYTKNWQEHLDHSEKYTK